jgi:hypothetical protein
MRQFHYSHYMVNFDLHLNYVYLIKEIKCDSLKKNPNDGFISTRNEPKIYSSKR